MNELINKITEDLVNKSINKFNVELEKYLIDKLNILGYSFDNKNEFEKFIKERVTQISHYDNPNHFELYIDYVNSKVKGILIGSYNTNIKCVFNGEKLYITIG